METQKNYMFSPLNYGQSSHMCEEKFTIILSNQYNDTISASSPFLPNNVPQSPLFLQGIEISGLYW